MGEGGNQMMSFESHDLLQMVIFVLLGLSASVVGPLLVLRRKSMLANSISHTVLLGIAMAYGIQLWLDLGTSGLMIALLIGSCFVAWLTTFLTDLLHKTLGLQEDASIGMVFSGLFAIGIVAVSCVFRHSHVGIEVIMGNADALSVSDLWPCIGAACLNLAIGMYCYRPLVVSTFDPLFSRSIGVSVFAMDYLLMIQTTLTVMVGFRVVGSFLVLAILVGPVLCVRPWVSSLQGLICGCMLVSSLCGLLAVGFSRIIFLYFSLPLSTAGLMVLMLFIVWGLSLLAYRGLHLNRGLAVDEDKKALL
jgi:manganese/zinc/iron transport system permease protein